MAQAKPKKSSKATSSKAVNGLPGNVVVELPANGTAVKYGTIVKVGRKQYGGSYYATLSASNYSLINTFTTKLLKAVKGSVANVTPGKLRLRVNNVHGNLALIGVLSVHGQTVQAHTRYFTQAMFTQAHKSGIVVYGNTVKGQTVNGKVINNPVKAHSNHVVLTVANTQQVIALWALKATSIQ